jgi:hypothetical protein
MHRCREAQQADLLWMAMPGSLPPCARRPRPPASSMPPGAPGGQLAQRPCGDSSRRPLRKTRHGSIGNRRGWGTMWLRRWCCRPQLPGPLRGPDHGEAARDACWRRRDECTREMRRTVTAREHPHGGQGRWEWGNMRLPLRRPLLPLGRRDAHFGETKCSLWGDEVLTLGRRSAHFGETKIATILENSTR